HDLLININSIKAIQRFYKEQETEIIQLLVDEKFVNSVREFPEMGYEYDLENKILKLNFETRTQIGKRLEYHFFNNI
ncbi:hypothetical protein, partial [Okeania sp. SIO2B3]|uniref:hypothetical protein n=1 Tax=Okeania sp. SIO2B3 TaxID=2607784 RepID=UPI0013C12E3F